MRTTWLPVVYSPKWSSLGLILSQNQVEKENGPFLFRNKTKSAQKCSPFILLCLAKLRGKKGKSPDWGPPPPRWTPGDLRLVAVAGLVGRPTLGVGSSSDESEEHWRGARLSNEEAESPDPPLSSIRPSAPLLLLVPGLRHTQESN